jgi:putative colanic acid biosynthesis acetyltransferase WcaF
MVQDLSTFQLPPNFRGKSALTVQLWWLVQSTLFRLSPQFMYGWRRWLLRIFGAKLGQGVLVRSTAQITYPWKLIIGDHSWIGAEVMLYNLGEIAIGSNVSISHRSCLCTGSHGYQDKTFPITVSPITIEDEVWLANDVFIAPGVRIGTGAVIGTRSTVFRDMPAMMVCYGNPAKPIKPRLNDESS